jgi:hypothetical protein
VTVCLANSYGGDKVTDCHIADDEALCPDWVGDNGGARSQDSVVANFAAIQKEYPDAKVKTPPPPLAIRTPRKFLGGPERFTDVSLCGPRAQITLLGLR